MTWIHYFPIFFLQIFQDTIYQSNLHFKSNRNLIINLPYPVVNPEQVNCAEDPYLNLLKLKSKYEQHLKFCRNEFKKEKKRLTKKGLNKVFKLNIPKYLLDLTQGKYPDPDPWIKGDYNWFYTGGTLCNIELNGNIFLISPSQRADNSIGISAYESTNFKNKIQINKNTKKYARRPTVPKFDDKILNLSSHSDSALLEIRKRNNVEILKCKRSENELNFESQWIYNSDIPFIDFSINPFNKTEVAVANVDRKVQIFSLEKSAKSKMFTIKIDTNQFTCDNLMQMKFYQPNSILLIDRASIFNIDVRTKDINNQILRNGYFACDDLCCVSQSKVNENHFYIASTHNLRKFDIRMFKSIKKWSHMLSHPPIALKNYVNNIDMEEVIFVSSPNQKMVLVDDSKVSDLFRKVPGNLETLRALNLNGRNFLIEDLEKRLNMSMTGIEICPFGSGMCQNLAYTPYFLLI